MIPCGVYAVPAAPGLHTLTQPDGTAFMARQWGDENLHGWETADGVTIVLDDRLKVWTYAEHAADGRLVSSAKIVGTERLPQGWPRRLRPGPADIGLEKRRLSRESKQRAAAPQEVTEGLAPFAVAPTGTGNVPVFLINFSNTTTAYTPSAFDTLLFGNGNNSMKDYYAEVSYGAFTVSAGPGGVAGWYTAVNTHNYYGQNDASGNDRWPGDLVYEAVAAADTAGFDFAPYDQDGDCYVDIVNIIHQGTGEEAGGPATDIWSHRWSLTGASNWGYSHFGAYTTNDDCASNPSVKVKVNDYVIQPEVLWGGQQTMGVFAHEYGHALDGLLHFTGHPCRSGPGANGH